jgi:DNA replication and repair protein RecF
MSISRLEVTNFRNLQAVSILPHPRLNLFTGPNGSGKSSVLEAIYFLCYGRTFRSGRVRRVINDNSDAFTVFALIDEQTRLGIQKSLAGNMELRLNGVRQAALAPLIRYLPIVLLEPFSGELFTDGSEPRRAQFDWGVFHVEHEFYTVWRRYQRALKQRNSLLRDSKTSRNEDLPWIQELSDSASTIHELRKRYFHSWQMHWANYKAELAPGIPVELDYSPGWETAKPLCQQLVEGYQEDRERGFTQAGPHRADLKVKINSVAASDVLSRGQQKLVAAAIKLSQLAYLESTGKQGVLLVDDLASELDSNSRNTLKNCIKRLKSQAFITGIEKATLLETFSTDSSTFKLFHVEQGVVKEMESKREDSR